MRDSGDAVRFSATQFGAVRTYVIFGTICVWGIVPCLVPFCYVRDKIVTMFVIMTSGEPRACNLAQTTGLVR